MAEISTITRKYLSKHDVHAMNQAAAESWLQFIGRHRRTDIPF